MIRFILFLLLLIPLMLGAEWLLANQGHITIDWFDYTIEISTALAIFLLVACCGSITTVMLALWQLLQWPERRRERRKTHRLMRGLSYLTEGFTALALGDESATAAALKKARIALPDEPLPKLLSAQLMQRQGKQDEARGFLRALLKHESTATLATHKLIEQHMGRHEWAEATALAEATLRDTPRDRWLILTLIDLYARTGNTAAMLDLTEGWHFRSPLSRAERHHYAAIAHYLQAEVESEPNAKLHEWQQAANFAPEFLPATLGHAAALTTAGQSRKARKILRAAWRKQPAAPLIPTILASVNDASPSQQARVVAAFMHTPPTVSDHLLQAQLAIRNGEFEQAKAVLEIALTLEENKQVYTLMADVARELRGSAAANGWLARAMDAPTGEHWQCARCSHAHEQWQTHCGSCDAFDSLRYERPEARITSVEVAVG